MLRPNLVQVSLLEKLQFYDNYSNKVISIDRNVYSKNKLFSDIPSVKV